MINTGIGWHEARIPTIAGIGAAGRICRDHSAHEVQAFAAT